MARDDAKDEHAPEMTVTPVRLLEDDQSGDRISFERRRGKIFRPLFVGPAILYRSADRQTRWNVDVNDGLLIPACPRTSTGVTDVVRFHEAIGRACRVSGALGIPTDSLRSRVSRPPAARQRVIDIYGWAIMYQLPGMNGVAVVDPHADFAELPAFYECPLELLDRSEFLLSRGIRHRPLAVVTRPEDFAIDRFGTRVNVFRRTARCRPPCRISRLLTR